MSGRYCPGVRPPTLVVHRRQLRYPTVDTARRLASGIPDARLALLDGASSAPYLGNTEAVLAAIDEFLGEGEEAAPRAVGVGSGRAEPPAGAQPTRSPELMDAVQALREQYPHWPSHVRRFDLGGPRSVTPSRQSRLKNESQPYPHRCVCRHRTLEPGAIPGQTSHREAGCCRGGVSGWPDPISGASSLERPGWHSPLPRLLPVPAGDPGACRRDTPRRYDGSRRRRLVRPLLPPGLPDPGLPPTPGPR